MNWSDLTKTLAVAGGVVTSLAVLWNLGIELQEIRDTRYEVLELVLHQLERRENFVQCVVEHHMDAADEIICWKAYYKSLEDQINEALRTREQELK